VDFSGDSCNLELGVKNEALAVGIMLRLSGIAGETLGERREVLLITMDE
jgi:hypothetical protein